MNSNFKSNDDLLWNYTQISGACIRHSASVGEPPVSFNPKLSTPPVYCQSPVSSLPPISTALLTNTDFDDFAEQLQLAGTTIHRAKPDIVLVPMRGGIRPWEHLRIYCNIDVKHSLLFPFTDREKTSEQTSLIIARGLEAFLGRERVSIVCIDAAEGGYGSEQLVKLLQGLHAKDAKARWDVHVCLFVPKDKERAPWQWTLKHSSNGNFQVIPKLFPVKVVIGEDVDDLMISLENFGKVRSFPVVENGFEYIIESAELPAVIDQKILEATHRALLMERFSTVIDIRLWRGDRQSSPGSSK